MGIGGQGGARRPSAGAIFDIVGIGEASNANESQPNYTAGARISEGQFLAKILQITTNGTSSRLALRAK